MDEVLNNNIIATYNVYEEARRAGGFKDCFCQQQSYPSTPIPWVKLPCQKICLMLKNTDWVKLDDPPAPDSLYGVSKLLGGPGPVLLTVLCIKFVCFAYWNSIWNNMDGLMMKGDKSTQDHLRALYLSKRDLVDIFDRRSK